MRYTSRKGFTLIDMAIVMVVMGLLTFPLIQQYNVYETTLKRDKTEAAMSSVYASILLYAKIYQRLPCPADPSLMMGDAEYGKEQITSGPSKKCIIGGVENYVGAVPFQTLHVSENLTIDQYGNKLTFAVSRSVIEGPIPFHEMAGDLILNRKNISVDAACNVTETIAPVADPQLVVLISHGANGDGAYPRNSSVADVCDGNGLGTTLELENCDGDTEFLDEVVTVESLCPTYSVAPQSLFSLSSGANYYDDMIVTQKVFARDMYMPSSENANTVYSEVSSIGIGTSNPEADIDVVGKMLVRGGSDSIGTTAINSYCNGDGDKCFNSKYLGQTGMICDEGAVKDIGYNEVECNTSATGLTPLSCGTDQYMTGFDSAGQPVCQSIP